MTTEGLRGCAAEVVGRMLEHLLKHLRRGRLEGLWAELLRSVDRDLQAVESSDGSGWLPCPRPNLGMLGVSGTQKVLQHPFDPAWEAWSPQEDDLAGVACDVRVPCKKILTSSRPPHRRDTSCYGEVVVWWILLPPGKARNSLQRLDVNPSGSQKHGMVESQCILAALQTMKRKPV